MKKLVITAFLFSGLLFISCEKEDQNHDHLEQQICEVCSSYCCEQVGTENCCCSDM